ncbi:MAG: transglycosylase domain-containing protein [Chloroflexota bacterium]|nr:MAG: hypothetical protein DIU68_05640 [Chloroflexota bacterium]
MSDRPSSTNNNPSEERDTEAVWHEPWTPGGWRVPTPERRDGEPGAAGGWRVPALPEDLDIVPDDRGAWHLPKPEDTRFSPEDEIDVVARAPDDAGLTAAAAGDEDVLPFDEISEAIASAELELEMPVVVGDEAGEDAPLPFAPGIEAAPEVPDDLLQADPNALPFDHMPEAVASEIDELVTPGLVYADDDDDTFSMSELIALASLVEAGPPTAEPGEAAPDSGAQAEADEPSPTDPAEYARRQLERLNAEQGEEQETAPAETQDTSDPAEYARRQLEQLEAQGKAEQEAPADEARAAGDALVERFRETERRVRDLRSRYRAGQLSRQQLQAELRALMILDADNVWWMMGVETDTWYRFDNGKWVPATPPGLERHVPSGVQSGDIPQDTVPPSDGGDQTVRTGPVQTDENYMPLPRAVPIRDPDSTLPGTAGVYLPPADMGVTQQTDPERTVPVSPLSGATVPVSPIRDAAGSPVSVPRPGPTPAAEEAAPSYDISQPSPLYEQVMKRRRQSALRKALIAGVIGLALLFLLGACGIVGGIIYYSSLAAPYQEEIAALANYQPQFQTARILDAEGNLIVELTSQEGGARKKVALRDISPFVVHAVVSTENERYFDDPGWDPIAIGRAFVQNILAGGVESGASTITQQIARNLILHDYTISAERKLQEIVIASEIAQRYDKNFILELYLNEVFFGNRSYGIEAAAEFYFNKSASDLNMAESAMLVGLIQAPATYDPVVNSQAAFDRMDTVLALMRRVGCLQFQHEPYVGQPFCIGDEQIRLGPNGEIVGGEVLIERALVETTSFRPREYTVRYPHFVNFVQAQIEQSFGTAEMYRRGFTIRTTLVPAIQDAAQEALARYVAAAAGSGINTGAVLVAEPATGAIRAMVGSPDFNNADIDGQVNNVLTWQQPGSSIKPVVYTAALEGVNRNGTLQYLTPASILWDVPTTYNTQPPYAPVNYDRRFHGPVALRYALQNSYNVPAVKVFEFIGPEKFIDTATRMGLNFLDDAQFGLPSALGSNEVRLYDHLQVYGTLANGGKRVPLFAITSITDANGEEVPLPARPEPQQVISPQVAFLMQNILADNEARADAFGLNSGLTIPGYEGMVAAKTGTTNDARDLWTMGFTTSMVVGVWTGTVDNSPTNATTGTAAIPIWNEVMRAALRFSPPQPFPDPGGITTLQICADTGTAYDPNQECRTVRSELFLANQPPPPASQAFLQTVAVDTWTGLRANQYCGENVEMRTFVNIADPFAVQWLASPDGQATARALGMPEQVEPLPQGECTPNTQLPNIRITQPGDGQQVQGQVQIVGAVVAPNFNRYQIEVASLNNPDSYTIIAGPITEQRQPGSTLATWDTTQVPNGLYRLRLAAFANDGGFVYRTVQVGVNNPLPTPTPDLPTAIPQAPTLAPDELGSPLPFNIQIIPATPQPTPEVPGL